MFALVAPADTDTGLRLLHRSCSDTTAVRPVSHLNSASRVERDVVAPGGRPSIAYVRLPASSVLPRTRRWSHEFSVLVDNVTHTPSIGFPLASSVTVR